MHKPNIENIEKISIDLLKIKPLKELKGVHEFYKKKLSRFFDENSQPIKKYFEFVSCPVCENYKIDQEFNIDNFIYKKCFFCNVVYNSPRLKNKFVSQMYASGEYKTYFERLVVKSQDIRKNVIEQRFFKQIDSFFVKPGKILDVGCGSGSFLKVCQENDWEVYGLDPSESAVITAKEKYNLEITHDYFENFNSDIKFDCVSFIGLEHLAEPMQGIAKAKRILNPGGLILFQSPSADCFLLQYCRDNNFSPYRYIESARHVLFFSKKSIDYICKKFDLELAWIETNGLDLQTILPFEFEDEVISNILNAQRILDEYLLGDHYRVFLIKKD